MNSLEPRRGEPVVAPRLRHCLLEAHATPTYECLQTCRLGRDDFDCRGVSSSRRADTAWAPGADETGRPSDVVTEGTLVAAVTAGRGTTVNE